MSVATREETDPVDYSPGKVDHQRLCEPLCITTESRDSQPALRVGSEEQEESEKNPDPCGRGLSVAV